MQITTATITTPIGNMTAIVNEYALLELKFTQEDTIVKTDNKLILALQKELDEYFHGKRRVFNTPIAPMGAPFVMSAWSALMQIPYGTTLSYTQEAKNIGKANAVHSVARANINNKIAILIPCHRAVTSNGRIGNYGGGVWRKEFLLNLEKNTLMQDFE